MPEHKPVPLEFSVFGDCQARQGGIGFEVLTRTPNFLAASQGPYERARDLYGDYSLARTQGTVLGFDIGKDKIVCGYVYQVSDELTQRVKEREHRFDGLCWITFWKKYGDLRLSPQTVPELVDVLERSHGLRGLIEGAHLKEPYPDPEAPLVDISRLPSYRPPTLWQRLFE